jgi:hypothetical protein
MRGHIGQKYYMPLMRLKNIVLSHFSSCFYHSVIDGPHTSKNKRQLIRSLCFLKTISKSLSLLIISSLVILEKIVTHEM